MRRLGLFLLITVVQGIMFLVPILVAAIVAREAYRMLQHLLEPLAKFAPSGRILGLLAADLLTLAAVLAVFLLAGLFVATRPGRSLSANLERNILYRVPGYLLLRGAAGGVPGLQLDSDLTPVLVRDDDGWFFGLLVERLPQGYCTIFVPDSPSPTNGSVRIVEASRVQRLEANMMGFLGCLTRSGTGAGKLAGDLLPKVEGREG